MVMMMIGMTARMDAISDDDEIPIVLLAIRSPDDIVALRWLTRILAVRDLLLTPTR